MRAHSVFSHNNNKKMFCGLRVSQTFFRNASFATAVHKHRNPSGLAFFNALNAEIRISEVGELSKFLADEKRLRNFFTDIGFSTYGSYLNNHFAFWLTAYASQNQNILIDYFSTKRNLDFICKDFIDFCFDGNIYLNPKSTLESFNYHNTLSDLAVKNELKKIPEKDTLNIIGYGLDEGSYERSIAEYLVAKNIARKINIYGFDPYAKISDGIRYLTSQELESCHTIAFDLVIARWVLHHVTTKNRWGDFVRCINKCNINSRVLIIEHGFLQHPKKHTYTKLYYLLNAIFDIVANIGLRPHYFTSTRPNVGENFFIEYLNQEDLNDIQAKSAMTVTHDSFDVGPKFPNQTIVSMHVT